MITSCLLEDTRDLFRPVVLHVLRSIVWVGFGRDGNDGNEAVNSDEGDTEKVNEVRSYSVTVAAGRIGMC